MGGLTIEQYMDDVFDSNTITEELPLSPRNLSILFASFIQSKDNGMLLSLNVRSLLNEVESKYFFFR